MRCETFLSVTPFCIISTLLFSCMAHADFYEDVLNDDKRNSTYIGFNTENYSESFSIVDLYRDHPSSLSKGSTIYSHSELNVSYHLRMEEAQKHSYFLGYFKRYDLQVEHSYDAARLYYLSRHPNKNESISLDLSMKFNALSSQGLRLGYQWDFNESARWLLYADIGQSDRLMSAKVSGNLEQNQRGSSTAQSLSGDISLDYYYRNDPLYSRKVRPSIGQMLALSTQLDLSFDVSKHRFLFKDLYFSTRWPSAPHTENQINTQKVQKREDGSLNIRPLGSGKEDFKSLNQKLLTRIYTQHEIATPWGGNTLLLDLNRIYLNDQIKIGWQQRILNNGLWGAKYSLLNPAIEVFWKRNGLNLKMKLDHYDLSLMKQLSFSLGYAF